MKPEELDKARNPLLPAAWVAIRRAALQARRQALMTKTAIVVRSNGRVVRITPNEVREALGQYAPDRVDESEARKP